MLSRIALPCAGLALISLLSACLAAMPLPDRQASLLAGQVSADSSAFHAALADQSAPQCAYEQNKNTYVQLASEAARLRAYLAAAGASAARLRSADALIQTIEAARASHALASADQADRHGPCLAPRAIALNAEAIARASAAVAGDATETGDR